MSGKAWKPSIIAALAALVAGCGGAHRTQPPAPVLPRTLAHDLAAMSDRVAAAAAQGDRCAAAGQAADLRQAAHNAVAAGLVAAVFRPRLLTAVDSLAASLPACTPSSDAGGGGGGHDQGKHKGEHKHGGGD